MYVTGESEDLNFYFDYATVAYQVGTGAQKWVARYRGPTLSVDDGNAIRVSPDGSAVFVTGQSTGDGTGFDYATIGYDTSTGAQLWATRYNDSGNLDDNAYALEMSSDGSTLFVTGSTATIAYDAGGGAQKWISASTSIIGWALGLSPDGSKLYVAGVGIFGTDDDMVTIASDAATGGVVWRARVHGPGSDAALALEVGPDGSAVFVTGDVQVTQSPSFDYATAAYRP